MDIWLINPYGPVPSEGWRDYRFVLIGKELARAGHNVTWWTANFSHHFKRFRSSSWMEIPIVPGFRIQLVPTVGYKRNISVGRLRFHSRFCRNLWARARSEEAPDVVLGVDPPQPVGTLSVRLAHHHGAKLIIDVMDQWPELFSLALPRALRPLAPLIFTPMYRARRRNLGAADAITALAETYLQHALNVAATARNKPHMTVFNGINIDEFRDAASRPVQMPRLPLKTESGIWAIYAGTLGENYDVDGVMSAALALRELNSPVTILVAGSGPRREDLIAHIKENKLRNLFFLGKLDHDVLIRLYGSADIGISPYSAHSNVAMPDKAYDYMAAGLPIVNSLQGELAAFLSRTGVGLQYRAGDGRDLAEKLDRLARDVELRRQMAQRSWADAMEFDAHVQYNKFARLIDILAR
jgi:glycosyltransferase involved in cell wall biosynthesis